MTPAFPPCSERIRQASLDEHRDIDKSQGHVHIRHLQASNRLVGHLDWPGFAQAIRIERTVVKDGKPDTEVSFAITSICRDRASAKELLSFSRGHWGIENRLHWVRDVTFGEDGCRMRTGDGPQNLAALRNAGLTLLRAANHNAIASALRRFATRPWDLLKTLRSF